MKTIAKNRLFKKGDKVRLVSKKQTESEMLNWIEDEFPIREIGDIFTVSIDCVPLGYVDLDELKYSHPPSKFDKI